MGTKNKRPPQETNIEINFDGLESPTNEISSNRSSNSVTELHDPDTENRW